MNLAPPHGGPMSKALTLIALILALLLIYWLLREPEYSDTYRHGVYCRGS